MPDQFGPSHSGEPNRQEFTKKWATCAPSADVEACSDADKAIDSRSSGCEASWSLENAAMSAGNDRFPRLARFGFSISSEIADKLSRNRGLRAACRHPAFPSSQANKSACEP